MAVPASRSNGFDRDKLQGYIKRCEAVADEASSEIGTIMKRKKDDTNEILNEAKGDGIPARPLKAILRRRAALRKAEQATEELSDEDVATFEAMNSALGTWADEVEARVSN